MPITVTNPNNRPVVTAEATTDIGVSIGIDYTSYYDRIATALETIAARTTTIASNSTTITSSLGSDSATISGMISSLTQSLENMELHQRKIKELSEGAGIHIVGPYEWLSMYAIYKLLLEQGVTDFASLKAQVNSLPKEF